MSMVRWASDSDRAGIGAVFCHSWQDAYRGMIPQDYLDSLTPESCAPPAGKPLIKGPRVTEADEQVVGAIIFGRSRDKSQGRIAEIYSNYVLPSYWGTGHGRELLRSAMDSLHAEGYSGMHLWVLSENARARRFYEKAGMAPTGKQRKIGIAGATLDEIEYFFPFES